MKRRLQQTSAQFISRDMPSVPHKVTNHSWQAHTGFVNM